jgi:hypothetical protein
MTTRIFSTIKKNLRLSKEFPTSLLLHKDSFGALDAETQYFCKSAGDFIIAFQPQSSCLASSNPLIAQLSWDLCDSENAFSSLIDLSSSGFNHPLALPSKLFNNYDLSLYPLTNLLPSTRSSSLLEQPPDGRDLTALNNSCISHISQIQPSDHIH